MDEEKQKTESYARCLSVGCLVEGYGNSRAMAVVAALATNRAAMRANDFPAQVEANPRSTNAFEVVRMMIFNAVKSLEDALAQLRRDARPGVRHGKVQPGIALGPGILPGR